MGDWFLAQGVAARAEEALLAWGLAAATEEVVTVETHVRVPDAVVYDRLEAAVEVAGLEPVVAALLGVAATRPTDALYLALHASASAEEALALACRYEAYWCSGIDLVWDGVVGVVHSSPRRFGRDLATAILLASLVAHLRNGVTSRFAPDGVLLCLEEPSATLERAFGGPLLLAQRDEFVQFTPAALQAALTHSHPPFAKFFEGAVSEFIERTAPTHSTRGQVTAALVRLFPRGEAGLPELARHLGTSERSLQRRLREEGTTCSQLVEELRGALARSALRNRTRRVSEIGYSLGFSHPSSFIRAFRSWEGCTPGQWRAQLS